MLDEETGGIIKDIIELGDFEGKLNQISVLYTRGLFPRKELSSPAPAKKRTSPWKS